MVKESGRAALKTERRRHIHYSGFVSGPGRAAGAMRAPAQTGCSSNRIWRRFLLPVFRPVFRPTIASDQHFTVGGHPRLGKADRSLQLKFQSNNLLHSVFAKISVLRRKCCFGIDAGNVRIDRLLWTRIQVDVSRLADFDFANLAFRHKAPQVNLAQIDEGDQRRPGWCL